MKSHVTRTPQPASRSPEPAERPGEHEQPATDGGSYSSLETAGRLGHHLETPTLSAPRRFEAATQGPGSPLPFRQHMERTFGQDLSGVRAYLGRSPQASSLDAVAATDGQSVLFQDSQPHPRVVAHEVAHVLQRRRSGSVASAQGPLSEPGSAAEREAQAVSPLAAAGLPVRPQASAGPGVHRLDKREFFKLIGNSVSSPALAKYYQANAQKIEAINANDKDAHDLLRQKVLAAHPPRPKDKVKAPPKSKDKPNAVDLRNQAREKETALASEEDVTHLKQGSDVAKLPPQRQQQVKLLQDIPKLTRSQYYQRVSEQTAKGNGGLEAYAAQRYGQRGKDVHGAFSKLGKGFDSLVSDPGLSSTSHLGAFGDFMLKQRELHKDDNQKLEELNDPWKARDAYGGSLKKVTVYRGLKLPNDQVANNILQNGMTSRLARSVESRLNDKEPLPNMSELDNKPMSNVVMHHVHPFDRTGYRLKKLQDFIANDEQQPQQQQQQPPPSPEKIAAARKKARRFIEDEDMPQSITMNEKAAAAISGGKMKNLLSESEQEDVEGDVYTYKLHMSPLDLIAPNDYLPQDSKDSFPDHYEMSEPNKLGVKKLNMDDALESLVMPMIYPHEIQGVKKWKPQEIPFISASYGSLLEDLGHGTPQERAHKQLMKQLKVQQERRQGQQQQRQEQQQQRQQHQQQYRNVMQELLRPPQNQQQQPQQVEPPQPLAEEQE